MAKSRQYSPARRVVLQVTLAFILAGITGLAAYISHAYGAERKVTLGPPQHIGAIVMRVPEGWSLARPQSPGLEVRFTEPGTRRPGRTLTIEQLIQNSPRLSAAELLMKDLDLGAGIQLEPYTLLGQKGVIANIAPYQTQFGEFVDGGLFAAAVFPNGFAVIVKITSSDVLGPSNERLLRQITENMTYVPPGGEVI